MRLPEVAAEMRQLAALYGVNRLSELADEISRRKGKRGPVVSRKMTESLRDQIREYRITHPALSQNQIAKVFNVNPGRVSEALHGKRK